ncbi:MAG: hypothetical protein HRT43_13585 [Campylobacteraceae bacterium]|nr:hypothetical protein [Campylobacteraceae bacterium]
MNKKTHINFNLNNFLLATSLLFDKQESIFYQTKPNHGKRVAFICLKIGEKFNLDFDQMSDLCSYSLLHNNGLFQSQQTLKHNCEISEENIQSLPFIAPKKNILLYQHERYNGSGTYSLTQKDIPLFSQIIAFASYIDRQFDLTNGSKKNKDEIKSFINKNSEKLFSQDLCEIFCDELSPAISFWLDLQDDNTMLSYIYQTLYDYTVEITYAELIKIINIFVKIMSPTNRISSLVQKCEKMADFYHFEDKDKYTFMLGASLVDIGKMYIPLNITNKISELSEAEFEQIKNYPYFTQKVLGQVMGFKEISTWAARVQETLDGKGYPYGLDAKELSLKDRLMATLHIYNALGLEKSYRAKYEHYEAIDILKEMAYNGKLDIAIIKDINTVFMPVSKSSVLS